MGLARHHVLRTAAYVRPKARNSGEIRAGEGFKKGSIRAAIPESELRGHRELMIQPPVEVIGGIAADGRRDVVLARQAAIR
jgi:hypothetical protein